MDTVAGCRADWPEKAKKRNSWIKGQASHPLLSGHVTRAWFH